MKQATRVKQAARRLLRSIPTDLPRPFTVSVDGHSPIWQAWLTVQRQLEPQCRLQPRGPCIRALIRELDRRLRLHLALSAWDPRLSRFALLARLRNLLALLPLDRELQEAGLQLLRGLNQPGLAALDQHLAAASAGLAVVVTGCRHRAPKLSDAVRRFAAGSGAIAVVGVVGDPGLRDWEIRFDPRTAVLRLPVSDAYEALPQKVGWAALALGLCRPLPALLKVDDDAAPRDLGAAVRLLEALRSTGAAAAGYPITTPSPLALDRGWHLGKSSARANRIAFSSIATKNWMSGGVGYLLAPAGVAVVSDYALHSWGFFEAMLYEDIAISMVLNAADAGLHWLDQAGRLGVSTERSDEIEQGHWAYDEALLT